MFSDVVFDTMQEIIDSMSPSYAIPEIYPPEKVMQMLALMKELVLRSDATWEELLVPEEKIKELAADWAKTEYEKHMKK